MYTICYWTEENGWTTIATVSGCEAAYNVYTKAHDFGESVGIEFVLCDGETGEIIAGYDDVE